MSESASSASILPLRFTVESKVVAAVLKVQPPVMVSAVAAWVKAVQVGESASVLTAEPATQAAG